VYVPTDNEEIFEAVFFGGKLIFKLHYFKKKFLCYKKLKVKVKDWRITNIFEAVTGH
jgi:hypothetical protein